MTWNINKVNGHTFSGEMVSSGIDFVTLTTAIDIRTSDIGSATSQAALDKIVEVISMIAQPVILGAPSGTGPFTLIFGIEHVNSIDPVAIVNAIVANQFAGMGFTSGNTSATVSPTIV